MFEKATKEIVGDWQTKEILTVKILQKPSMQWNGTPMFRIELMSESDIQFYYQANIHEHNFVQIQNTNSLKISYSSFLETFTKLLEDC